MSEVDIYASRGGFARARKLLLEFEAERASIVRRQITELLDVIDKRVERALQCAQAVNAAAGHDGDGDVSGVAGDAGEFTFQDGELRADQAVQGIDPDIEKIEAILNFRKAIFNGLGHGTLPSLDDEEEANRADEAAHRLSGGAE